MAYDRYGRERYSGRGYGRYNRPPEDYDYDDRGFFDRAGDEVRSWFGDEEAERRRRWDARQDERDYGRDYYGSVSGYDRDDDARGFASRNRKGYGYEGNYGLGSYGQRQEYYGTRSTPREYAGSGYGAREGGWGSGRSLYGGDDRGWSSVGGSTDWDYRSWRNRQLESLDREYDDYRRERQGRFDNEFGSWRQQRATQRSHLTKITEHMEVLGSDGQHVGTVDKVKGDRIKLARNDQDANGRHHYVPCSWIQSVDANGVRLNRTADKAQQSWQTEESAYEGSSF